MFLAAVVILLGLLAASGCERSAGGASEPGSGAAGGAAGTELVPRPVPEAPSEPEKAQPVESVREREPVESEAKPIEQLKELDLKLEWKKAAYGILLDAAGGWRDETGGSPYVKQTIVSPDRSRAVHLIRRSAYGSGELWYRLDAVVVQPEAQRWDVYPLANTWVAEDAYAADSVAGAYGFIDNEHLVYIEPDGDPDARAVTYHVGQLNIFTGETARLVEHAFADPTPDHFGRSWLDAESKALYVNRYGEGSFWSIDLASGESRLSDKKYTNSWPEFRLFPSPNGDRFWTYEQESGLTLYASGEGALASFSIGDNQLRNYPPARWSPFGSESVIAYTLDGSSEHVIRRDVAVEFAPQAVAYFDRNGNLLRDIRSQPGQYVDWAGWVEGGEYGLLRFYKLDRRDEADIKKIDAVYMLIHIRTGELRELAAVANPGSLSRPQLVYPSGEEEGLAALIDTEALQWWTPGEAEGRRGTIVLAGTDRDDLVWVTNRYDAFAATFYRYSTSEKTVTVHQLDTNRFHYALMEGDWAVAVNEMIRYVRVP